MKESKFTTISARFTKEKYKLHVQDLCRHILSRSVVDADDATKLIYEDNEDHAHAPESRMDVSGAVYLFKVGEDKFQAVGRGEQSDVNYFATMQELQEKCL